MYTRTCTGNITVGTIVYAALPPTTTQLATTTERMMATDEGASARIRVEPIGHLSSSWEALFRRDYDVVLALSVIMVVMILWIRALYQHWTIIPRPDTYKVKYH